MAYIKVDYSDDRVYGRFRTGPFCIVPGQKSQLVQLFDIDDIKCERPLEPRKLTRAGEYKSVLNIFTKQNIDAFKTLEFATIYAPNNISAINGSCWKESKLTKDRQQWDNSTTWCKAYHHFYHTGAEPLEICFDVNTTGNEIVECVEVFIEFHYRS